MPSINRLYFSGFKHERVISTDIRTPNAIAIDFTSQKLYWADARLDKITTDTTEKWLFQTKINLLR